MGTAFSTSLDIFNAYSTTERTESRRDSEMREANRKEQ